MPQTLHTLKNIYMFKEKQTSSGDVALCVAFITFCELNSKSSSGIEGINIFLL